MRCRSSVPSIELVCARIVLIAFFGAGKIGFRHAPIARRTVNDASLFKFAYRTCHSSGNSDNFCTISDGSTNASN